MFGWISGLHGLYASETLRRIDLEMQERAFKRETAERHLLRAVYYEQMALQEREAYERSKASIVGVYGNDHP